jgi:alpha-glucosidase
LLKWRRTQPLLVDGDIEFLVSTDSVLAFRRFDGARALLVAFNLSPRSTHVALPGLAVGRAVSGHGLPEGTFTDGQLALPGHGVAFFELAAR